MPTTKEVPITKIDKYPADENHKYPQTVVEIMTNEGNIKGYANTGNWNKEWKAGTKVKADVEMKESKTGTKYAKLSCPEDMRPKGNYGGGSGEKLLPILTEIRDELKELRMTLTKNEVPGNAPEPMDVSDDKKHDSAEPEQQGEPDINIDDIPF